MRDMFEQPGDWHRKALQASTRLREEFSWDVIADKAIAALADGQARASVTNSR
jgi:hypothetical protein